jgi:cell division protease FtsH
MGGRVAEELTFGKENITSGAVGDIDQATKMARAMVTRMGFSDELGLVAYGENQDEVFLGMSMGRQQNVSEATAQKIDREVRRLIEEAYEEAKRILTERHDDHIKLAEALLEYETLSGDEIKDLLAGNPPRRDGGDEAAPTSRSSAVPPAGSKRAPDGGEPEGGPVPQPS